MRPFIFMLLLASSINTAAQSIQLTPVLSGIPWLIGAKTDGSQQLYIVRQDGFIHLFQAGNTLSAHFLDWSAQIKLDGEQGLLGLAFHPDYNNNGFFYIYYSKSGTGESVLSRMSRSAADPNVADPNSEVVLLTFPHPNPNHVGGALEFGPDGYLYLSTGDGGGVGDPDGNGQDNTQFLGKILRIDVNNSATYTVPADNPFVGQAGVLPEIYCTGLRNPWRMTFDRLTGDLWIADVGQGQREEVDIVEAGSGGGQNFGWSCKEGTNSYNPCPDSTGLVYPLYEYPHNANTNCSGSITGGYVYRGYQYADLFGKYLFTDFCTGEITALDKSGGFVIGLPLGTFTPFDYVSFVEDQEGELYIAGYFSNKLYQISSNNCEPVAFIEVETAAVPGCDSTLVPFKLEAYGGAVSGMSFQWRKDGADLPGETGYQFTSNQPGIYDIVVTNPLNGCSSVSTPYPVTVFQSAASAQELTVEIGTEINGVIVTNDTTIVYTLTTINGCDSVVLLLINAVVDAQEPDGQSTKISITPNPGSDVFRVTGLPLFSTFRIVDAYGRLVEIRTVNTLADEQFSLNGKPSGIYYLVSANVSRRFLKI